MTDELQRIVYPALLLNRDDSSNVSGDREWLIDRVAETEQFYRTDVVAIDTTEDDPFTGDRTGHEDEIIGTKAGSDEYAYQWATI